NCYQPGLQLDGSASSTGSDFQYTWQDDQATVIGSSINQNISTSGWYYLQVLNSANGCSSLDSVLIDEDFAAPTALAGTDGLLDCSDPSYTLDGSASSSGPNFSYEWQNEAGSVLSTMNALNVQSPGTYILTVFNQENGCASADTAVVTTNQIFPVAQVFTPDLLTCVQLEATLNTQGSSMGSNYDYLWSTLSGPGQVQQGPDGPFVLQPGLYELIVLDSSNGCSDTATVQVNQDIAPPVADAGATLHLNCFQEDGQLDGSQSTPIGQLGFAWTTTDGQINASALTATPTVAAAGIYLLTVTDLDNGCTDQADISVTASFLETLEVAPTPPNCYGETGLLEITQTLGGVPPYLYSIDGGAQFSSQTFYANLEAGLYEVLVQDADGCTLEQTVEVTSPPALTAFVEPQVFLRLGDSYQLEIQTNLLPGQIDSILWTPDTYLDCTDCPDPITSPLDNIQYEVIVVDTAGCIVRGLTDIYVDGRSQIYIPNGFSPDGDGQNEVFMIFAATHHVQNIRAFQVFNRWGEEVFAAYNFQPNDPTFGWDGSFRGQALDPAVFVYYAEIELIDGRREVVKGDVVLVK
ncbi:MAG: gliding motility-associated C-terminal domain-containing protein, partial [Phaeodactylibacter sp.]|nr:gliding motility-associated C-terminal domain-containing protein [Phaeodactylibacter sp.]